MIAQTTPCDSPGTQVFDDKDIGEIPTGSPPTGVPNRGGVGYNRRLSTNISQSLKTVLDRHTITMEGIKTRMFSIEWRYFQ